MRVAADKFAVPAHRSAACRRRGWGTGVAVYKCMERHATHDSAPAAVVDDTRRIVRHVSDLIRAEYTEMPCLSLTLPQAMRLWSVDKGLCELGLSRPGTERDSWSVPGQEVPSRAVVKILGGPGAPGGTTRVAAVRPERPLAHRLLLIRTEGSVMTPALTTIMVATDFSPTSKEALEYGRMLAERFGAPLHLVHVCEQPAMAAAWSEGYSLMLADLQEEVRKEAEQRLASMIAPDGRFRSRPKC